MEDQLVLFDTAKLAKEKGFKEDCTHYYNNKTKSSKPFMHDDNPKVISVQDGTNLGLLTIAPTQSLLQKWLREKYDVIIIIDNLYDFHEEDDTYFYKIYNEKYVDKERELDDYYLTYEEALEIGLQEALKMI
jgi:hypothetical protein